MNLGLFILPPRIKSFFAAVDFAKAAGFAAIEPYNILEFAQPDLKMAEKLAAYAQSQGIAISCFTLGANIARPDNRAEIEKLKDYARVAQALGSPYLHHTILPGLSHAAPKESFKTLLERSVLAVREIYDFAHDLGVRCAYENQGFHFNGRDNLTRLLEAVDREIALVADLGNIYFVNEKIEDFVGHFAPFIEHVHVKDYFWSSGQLDRPGEEWLITKNGSYLKDAIMGQGITPFSQVFKILKNASYKGSYSLEYCGQEDAVLAIRASSKNLRSIYARSKP